MSRCTLPTGGVALRIPHWRCRIIHGALKRRTGCQAAVKRSLRDKGSGRINMGWGQRAHPICRRPLFFLGMVWSPSREKHKIKNFTRARAPDFLRLAHPKVGAGATPVQGNLYCSEAQCVHQPPTLSPQLSALSAQLSAPRAQLLARLRWAGLSRA